MGIFGGLIPTFLSPFFKWNIEKWRDRRNNRKQQLDKLFAWLSKSEKPCTDSLHYLDKKINSIVAVGWTKARSAVSTKFFQNL